MARKKKNLMDQVVAKLVGGVPMDYRQRPDGTLVVIGPEGRKREFTAAEVRQVGEKLINEEPK